jgi:hypothetical protein
LPSLLEREIPVEYPQRCCYLSRKKMCKVKIFQNSTISSLSHGRKRTVPKAHQQFKIQIASNQICGLSVNIYCIQLFNVWATGSFVTLKICPF